jgi:hypothetical protein
MPFTTQMTLQQTTSEAIRNLARAAVGSQAGSASEFYGSHWPQYYPALDSLVRDAALANRSAGEVADDLWHLLDELTGDKERYRERRALSHRLAEFAAGLARETGAYEVACAIEALRLPDTDLVMGKTAFVFFGQRRARQWGMSVEQVRLAGRQIIGRAAGMVTVQAGSFDRALELAAEEIDTSLNLLRTALDAAPTTPAFDELYLQRRGIFYVTKRLGATPDFRLGGKRGFRQLELDLRKGPLAPMHQVAISFARDIGPLFDGGVPAGLAAAVLRALEWMGSSVTRESYDDKIVDLCTALECMLTVESDRLKGEAIALRYALLTQRTTNLYATPHAILPIYRLRSEIIHGARRRIAGHTDYTVIRDVATDTVGKILRMAQKNRTILAVKYLIAELEKDADEVERLLLMIFDGTRFKDDRPVEKYGRAVVARLRGVHEDAGR